MFRSISCGLALSLFVVGAASATTCPSNPYTLTNGSTADASQVMANFDSILTCANGSLVASSGGTLTGGTLAGTTTLTGTTNLPVSGVITSTGVIGAGTSSPSSDATNAKLAVVGTAGQDATTLAESNTKSIVSIRGNSSSAYSMAMGSATGDVPYIQGVTISGGSSAANLLLNPFGANVGIGMTSPGYLLQVNGTAYATAWNTPSDVRLKTNIQPITGGLDLVKQLRPVRYQWRSPSDREIGKDLNLPNGEAQIGFIAQEVERVIPEAVVVPSKKSNGVYSLKEDEIIPVLTKAIQEQQAEIEQLRAEVAALKAAH